MLTEAALSFLSIGVQPPDASWGTIILDGQGLLYTRPGRGHRARESRSRSRCWRSTCFGDGVRDALDPAREAPSGARRLMLLFVAPAALDGVRAVRDQRARLPDLLRHPGRRPGGADRGPERGPSDARGRCARTSGSTGRCPSSTRLMMKKLFVTRDLTSFVNRGAKVIPQIVAGRAGDAVARDRRGGDLGRRRDR